jgi:hypothetical protein
MEKKGEKELGRKRDLPTGERELRISSTSAVGPKIERERERETEFERDWERN